MDDVKGILSQEEKELLMLFFEGSCTQKDLMLAFSTLKEEHQKIMLNRIHGIKQVGVSINADQQAGALRALSRRLEKITGRTIKPKRIFSHTLGKKAKQRKENTYQKKEQSNHQSTMSQEEIERLISQIDINQLAISQEEIELLMMPFSGYCTKEEILIAFSKLNEEHQKIMLNRIHGIKQVGVTISVSQQASAMRALRHRVVQIIGQEIPTKPVFYELEAKRRKQKEELRKEEKARIEKYKEAISQEEIELLMMPFSGYCTKEELVIAFSKLSDEHQKIMLNRIHGIKQVGVSINVNQQSGAMRALRRRLEEVTGNMIKTKQINYELLARKQAEKLEREEKMRAQAERKITLSNEEIDLLMLLFGENCTKEELVIAFSKLSDRHQEALIQKIYNGEKNISNERTGNISFATQKLKYFVEEMTGKTFRLNNVHYAMVHKSKKLEIKDSIKNDDKIVLTEEDLALLSLIFDGKYTTEEISKAFSQLIGYHQLNLFNRIHSSLGKNETTKEISKLHSASTQKLRHILINETGRNHPLKKVHFNTYNRASSEAEMKNRKRTKKNMVNLTTYFRLVPENFKLVGNPQNKEVDDSLAFYMKVPEDIQELQSLVAILEVTQQMSSLDHVLIALHNGVTGEALSADSLAILLGIDMTRVSEAVEKNNRFNEMMQAHRNTFVKKKSFSNK